MKAKIICILVMTLLITSVLPVVGIGNKDIELDQYSTEDNPFFEFPVQQNYDVAQSFIPTMKKLTSVVLKIEKVGDPGGFSVSIRKNLYDNDLTKVSKLQSEIPAGTSWVEFNFEDIMVTNGETYYIVCSSEGGVIINYYLWRGSSNNPYLNGHGWLYDILMGVWNERADVDFCFKTYADKSQSRTINTTLFYWLQNHLNLFPILRLLIQRIELL
jgi:hypothetical protein